MTILVNAYSTRLDAVEPTFEHDLLGHRDYTDPELSEHLHGFIGYVLDGGKRDMSSTLYAIMRHIERVHHHYSFEIDKEQLEPMSDWGWESNAIFYLPDGTVRDPSGAVLVDPDTGEPAEEAEIPFPSDARERKLRSESQLVQLGVHTPETLPPVIGEQEVLLRAADDVAWRAIALFIVAVRAESLASNRPIPLSVLKEKSPMAFEAVTEIEMEFLKSEDPDQQVVVNMAWRYEALYVLQWALGFHDDLKLADEICNVPAVAQAMVDRGDRQIVQMAQLRPTAQILDALDWNQRSLWAARQARLNDSDPPANLDGGVLVERQHALNWLVRLENAEWDEVDTPS
ncbi:MAG: DUF4272 domain-containing protein [Pirellulaceae bacterium]|nr:DUF4272 domain-containing protein [Pirellulaceae bacterium]